MSRNRPRRPLAAVLAVVVAVATLLAGCSSIPTSGPIEQGAQIGLDPEDQFIRVIARPPRPGMTPTQVVEGFLEASASFDGDHAVAREYLAPPIRPAWDPSAGVRVYDSPGLTLEETETGRVSATGGLVGTISADGRFEVAPPGRELSEELVLAQVDGEWRITALPPGLVLSRSDVERAFRTYDVYFFDPAFSILVPDPRTIPVIGPGLATTLAAAVLSGPTRWLAPAVRTAVPDGTELALEAVPIENGIARVDLTAPALGADDTTRRALSAQLVWTLKQLPDVTAVDLTVSGQPYVVPGATSPQPRDSWPNVDPAGLAPGTTPYVVRDQALLRLGTTGPQPVSGAAGEGDPPLGTVALSADGTALAAVSPDGARLYTGEVEPGGALTERLVSEGLSAPALDRTATAWTVDGTGVVQRVAADGTVTPVAVDGLPDDATVLDLALSRDGTRAALVLRRGTRTLLQVARIERRGADVRIAGPQRVETRLSEVDDVVWEGPETLAVLASDGAGPTQVFLVDVARGTLRALGAPEDPRYVAAAPAQPLLVGAGDGRVYQSSSGLWRPRTQGTAPVYPG
ncbi:MAG: LpqB family beta-propeller domain-containing protein [Candidatus Nanopelagicales bacterium]